MTPIPRISSYSAGAVLLFDVCWVLATQGGIVHFGWRGPALLLVYLIAGSVGMRAAGLKASMLVGAAAASSDAAVAVIWALATGRLPAEYPAAMLVALGAGIVLGGAICGLVGGSFLGLRRRYTAA